MKIVTALISAAVIASSFLSLPAGAAAKIIQVDRAKEACLSGGVSQSCFRIREGSTGQWFLWAFGIENFNYNPGALYTLLVDEKRIIKPVPDQPSKRYVLIRVLSES